MEALETPLVNGLFLVAMAASVAFWGVLWSRWQRGHRVLPVAWRRPVPWGGREAAAIFLLHLVSLSLVPLLFVQLLPSPVAPGSDETTHFAVRLLLGMHNPLAVAWVVVAVVLITPAAEEFVYRLVIQGWLESLEPLVRRRFDALRRVPGLLPLLSAAVLFGMMHARGSSTRADPTELLLLVTGVAVGNILVLVTGIALLRSWTGASWSDLGWDRRCVRADAGVGLLGYLAAFAPVFLAQLGAYCFLPEDVAADPAGIFVFALMLGWLYLRTHRLVPSIVCHMALNAQTVVMILLLQGQST